MCVFIAAQFIIAKLWNQPRCPSRDEWIKKMWYTYTMEFYSAIKKNKTILFAGKQTQLETIILNEISQTQREMTMCFFSHMCKLEGKQKG